ncbi:TorD/DmsD family molecular chaperone [Vibrio sonorensis]|uniref:TorD/DmsD family molecular chaperone n=1 Tax=Vibrio sonorensis TaxID=1004316 RepID=UPI0008DAB4DB|nr:molecular chaperone TorD family protein [Vibrio sonorensis]
MNNDSLVSEIYLLLATLYRAAPENDLLAHLSQLDPIDGGSQIDKAWTELKHASAKALNSNVHDEHQDLFIGIGRGEVMPFASWHLTGSLMEKPLANIRESLVLLGFERQEHVKEPEDHISALCEVMSQLVEYSEPESQAFFNQHIETWFPSFTKQIRSAQNSDFYLAVAELTDAFLTIEKVKYSQVQVHHNASNSKVTKNNNYIEEANID